MKLYTVQAHMTPNSKSLYLLYSKNFNNFNCDKDKKQDKLNIFLGMLYERWEGKEQWKLKL